MRPGYDILIATARDMHARSYAHGDSDVVAWDRFRRDSPDLIGAPAAVVAESFFLARWQADGFPRVVAKPRLSASLMATGIAREQMVDVLPPWRAFVIEIVDSPLTLAAAGSKVAHPIDRVEVHYSTHHHGLPSWTLLASCKSGVSLQRMSVRPEDWLNDIAYQGPADAFSSELEDGDLRTLELLSRLVAGLCLHLSPEALTDAERRARGKSYRSERRGPAVLRDYVTSDAVTADVRSAVAEYAAHGGRAPTVRRLVRGHWKRQHHGEGRALRKWIHVEPYWRGLT